MEAIATKGWRHQSPVTLVSRLNRRRRRKNPSPVLLRQEKTPERDTLSPGERAMTELPPFLPDKASPYM